MYHKSSFLWVFLSANRILETMGDTKKTYLPIFILIRLEISKGWFVEMFFSVRGTLKMMDARKIPIGSGSDFDFKRKNAQKCS